MKLGEMLKEMREKYEYVSGAEELARVGKVRIMRVKVRNKRTSVYLLTVLKTGEVIDKIKIAESKVKETVASVKKTLKMARGRQQQGGGGLKGFRDTEKLLDRVDEIKQKQKIVADKKLSDYKYKTPKEKQDILYIWFIYAYIREHLIDGKIIIKKEDNTYEFVDETKNPINVELFKLMKDLGYELTTHGVVDGSVKFQIVAEEHKKIHNRVINYFGQTEEFYHIIIGLYLAELWKSEVKFKALKGLKIDHKFVTAMLDGLKDTEISMKVYEDSEDFAKLIYREIYGEKILTHKEVKKIFNR